MSQSKKGKVYALLIGVDKFNYFLEKEGDLDLDGCVRDAKEVEAYLKQNIPNPRKQLYIRRLHSLTDKSPKEEPLKVPIPCAQEETFPATRDNIIDAFQQFLTQAKEGDTAFVYYSGHGAGETRPEELWHLDSEDNTSHRGQSIICTDTYSMQDDVWVTAIRDWEIRWLVAEVAKKNPHILVLTDCCHSSGNTRSGGVHKDIKVKSIPAPKNPKARPIADYVFYQRDAKTKELLDTKAKDFYIPEGRHIALAAANNYELAKESTFTEGRHGVFTYFLLKTLRKTGGNISYRNLTKLIRANTMQEVEFQTPQYYTTVAEDGDNLFLGGAVATTEKFYGLRPFSKKNILIAAKSTAGLIANQSTDNQNDKAILDAGSLHGIPSESVGKTYVDIYLPAIENGVSIPEKILKGQLINVRAQESIVQLENGAVFPENRPFMKAVITATPVPKTKVFLMMEIDEEVVPHVSDTLKVSDTTCAQQKAVTEGYNVLKKAVQKNPFLEIVNDPTLAQFHLYAYHYEGKAKYRITKKDTFKALVAPTVGFSIDTANSIVSEMVHIARWERTLHLENPHPKIIQPGDIELVVMDENGKELENTNGLINLVHQKSAQTESITRLKFKVRLNNQNQVPLYCALLHLSANYAIETSYLPPDTHLGSKSYKDDIRDIAWEKWEVYALSHIMVKNQKHKMGLPFGFVISDEKFRRGIRQETDHFKLIASTEQFDARHLFQGALESPSGFRQGEKPKVNSSLDAIMQEVRTRKEPEIIGDATSDWITDLVTVRTTRTE